MSKYGELLRKPPVLDVYGKPREMKIDLVSAMCDNRSRWTIKENEDGSFEYKLKDSKDKITIPKDGKMMGVETAGREQIVEFWPLALSSLTK